MRIFALALPYILHLLPPAVAWVGGSRHVLWFASGLLIAAATVAVSQQSSAARRIVASALNLLVAFANVLLTVSFLVQGQGFNIEFFAHADRQTLAFAAVALRPVLLVLLAYFLLTLACPFLIPTKASTATHRPRLVAVATVAGLALNAPAWSFGWHIAGVVTDVQYALWVPKPILRLAPAAPHNQAEKKSLLLIFAESLEATYSRADIFGEDLTPRLTALAASGKQFTDMRQVSLTAWTTGAMVAAQCARPLSAGGQWQDMLQSIATGVSPEMEGATCLGDVLAAYGYHTVLMTGTAIEFGGMDTFHAAHGFVERLGFDTLRRNANAAAQQKWGREHQRWRIEDQTLFALARAKLDELAKQTEPFALLLTTMDTHGPSGFPSTRCGDSRGMVDAVRCADSLIAEFVKDIRDTHPDVVVALLTDHLLGSGGVDEQVIERLAHHTDERRLRFAVWGPDVAPGVIERTGTHFDIMPTLLDFLGMSAWTEHYLGASLLRFESPWFGHERPLSLRVVHELPTLSFAAGDEVRFDPNGPIIELAGRRLLATSKGLHLRDAIFAIRFDDAGTASGFRIFGHVSAETALDDVTQWADGNLLVGVSTHQPANRSFSIIDKGEQGITAGSHDANAVFFVGAPGTEDFVAGPLRVRQTVENPEQ